MRASKWVGDPDALARLMRKVSCQGGFTQIGKVLAHARRESESAKVNAVVYVGDCMEEDVDQLAKLAGELGLVGVPVFLFQEGREPKAERAFREIARLSRGAYCPFDAGSAKQLRDLLTAVAVYATGGRKALMDFSDGRRAARPCASSSSSADGLIDGVFSRRLRGPGSSHYRRRDFWRRSTRESSRASFAGRPVPLRSPWLAS